MKHRVLFVTQTLGYKAACGIGLIGKLIGETLLKHPEYEFQMVAMNQRLSSEIETVLCIRPRSAGSNTRRKFS